MPPGCLFRTEWGGGSVAAPGRDRGCERTIPRRSRAASSGSPWNVLGGAEFGAGRVPGGTGAGSDAEEFGLRGGELVVTEDALVLERRELLELATEG